MSLIAPFIHQTLTSISSVSEDKYGDTTASVLYTSVPCRVEKTVLKIYDRNANIKDSKFTVFVTSAYSNIDYNYEVIYNGNTYKIVDIDENYGIATGSLDHIEFKMK